MEQQLRRVIVISQGGLLLLTLLLYVIFRPNQLMGDFWDGSLSLMMVLYAGVLSGIGIRLFSVILEGAWPAFQSNMEDTVIQALKGIQGVDFLLISLPPAVIEELFFRGFLQPYAGIWVGAAIFSMLHWGFQRALWAHGVHAFLIGLFLGWLSVATGSLLAPMVAHGINNLMASLYIKKMTIF